MQESETGSESMCLLCCQQRDIFILPHCNHKHMCWRCCMNMIKVGKFECPFCKKSVDEKEMIIFVTLQQMLSYSYADILKVANLNLFKSEKNSNFYYSNEEVAERIQYQISYNCPFEDCTQLFEALNQLKKHLDVKHKKQYCDICLNNRKCIQSEQLLYSSQEYQRHIKQGQFTENGDLVLFHPTCDFCKQTFYDIDEFRRHLELCHEKCFICTKSAEQLKYVYYNNYEQATQHFRKSHFYCQIGNCLTTKFQNVFVSEQAMQEHVARVHKKTKKSNQPIMNIELGFNKVQKDQVFEWDKIGKNFMPMFKMVEKQTTSTKLQIVEHQNSEIDLRDFYPQQTKKTLHWPLNKVKQVFQDKLYDLNNKTKQYFIDDIDFFKPLEMQPLTKIDLEKFLNQIFDPKLAGPIINKFFAGRQDFSSVQQYFGYVKQKMKSYSKIAYFYAFPQLVRFFKNENPHKAAMDEFYYQTLKELKVKKNFIIHVKSKYSQILFLIKDLIQKQIQERDEDSVKCKKQLDADKYLTFLKDLNPNFYIENQENLFYVSKQKITNLYHMINRCKVKDFLKMNWLLKIGFSNQAYKIICKDFYYKEEKDCPDALKRLTIQELAYLYSYCTICLQAIFDKQAFKIHKQRPQPLFLSQILNRIKKSSTHLILQEIRQLESKSLKLDYHVKQKKNKGVIINKEEHPSLLDRSIEAPLKSKPPDKQTDFPKLVSFGTKRPKVWNQSVTSSNKKANNPDQYPSILSNTGTIKNKKQKEEEEDFPVFHFIGVKDKKAKNLNKTMVTKSNLKDFIGWEGSSFVPSQWDEQLNLKTWQKRQQDQAKRKIRHQVVQQQKRKGETKQNSKFSSKDQKEGFIDNIISKNKKAKIDTPEKSESSKSVEQEPMIVIKSKKHNKIDEQQEVTFSSTKKKKKNKSKAEKKQQQKKQTKQQEKKVQIREEDEMGLFERIERESQILAKKRKKQEQKIVFKEAEPYLSYQIKDTQQNKFFNDFDQRDYIEFSAADFPQLEKPKKPLNIAQNKPSKVNKSITMQPTISNKKEQLNQVQEEIKKQKKTKMRYDDTSSQEQKSTKKQTSKAEHKTSEDFISITDRFQKQAQNKISKVNQIIQTAKKQDQPQNVIKIKKGKKGKKQIIEHVNFYAL